MAVINHKLEVFIDPTRPLSELEQIITVVVSMQKDHEKEEILAKLKASVEFALKDFKEKMSQPAGPLPVSPVVKTYEVDKEGNRKELE